ncbi:hypothetical protein I3W98_21260, partial [Streptomyces cavourensis]|nr:hypothetical protein [Streptomyces cavourensis]
MAKGRNNLLGVGGQRKKLSRADQQGAGSARVADRKVAEDKKQELVRKMRGTPRLLDAVLVQRLEDHV